MKRFGGACFFLCVLMMGWLWPELWRVLREWNEELVLTRELLGQILTFLAASIFSAVYLGYLTVHWFANHLIDLIFNVRSLWSSPRPPTNAEKEPNARSPKHKPSSSL